MPPIHCDQCDYATRHKSNLNQHQLIHEGGNLGDRIPIEPEKHNESFLLWLKYIFFALQSKELPKVTTKK